MATKNSPHVKEVFDKCNLVFFRVQMISPERDLGLSEKEGDVYRRVELVNTFDRSLLAPFLKHKQRGNRLCVIHGTRVETLSAWLVNNERLDDLMAELGKISEEVADETQKLVSLMPTHVKDFASRHPKYTSAILDLAPTAKEIGQSMKCVYGAYRLRAEDILDNSGCVADALQTLHGQVLHEFAQTLRDAKISPGSSTFTQATAKLLERMIVKARSLDFLNPILTQVADTLEQALKLVPPTGRILGIHATALAAVIDQLLLPQKMIANNGFLQFNQSVDLSDEEKPTPKPRGSGIW